eukprot:gene8822-771_t
MPKKTESGKVQLYTITFNAVLNHSEISKSFHDFSKEKKKIYNWDFILAVHVLKSHMKKGNKEESTKYMRHIIYTFLESETKQLRLISEEELSIASQIITTWKNQQFSISNELLQYLQEILIEEYKNTTFEEFLKTPIAEKLIKKFKKETQFIVPILTQKFDYKDEDFEVEKVTEMDFDFFEHISKEKLSNETLFESPSYKLQIMNQNYFPNVTSLKNIHIISFEYVFDYPYDGTICGMFKDYPNKPYMTYCNILDHDSNDFIIIEQHYILPETLPKIRKSVVGCKLEKERLHMISKSVKLKESGFNKPELFDLVLEKDGIPQKVEGTQEFFFSAMEIVSLDKKKTKFILNSAIELGSVYNLISRRVIKKVFTERYNDILKKLKKLNGHETFYDLRPTLTSGPEYRMSNFFYKLYVEKFGEETKEKKIYPIEKKNEVDLSLLSKIQSDLVVPLKKPNFEDLLMKNISNNIINSSKKEPEKETKDACFNALEFEFTTLDFSPTMKKSNIIIDEREDEILDLDLDFVVEDFDELPANAISEIDDLVSFLETIPKKYEIN